MATMRIGPICRKEVKEALEVYREEVEASDLASDTKRTYLRHAETFVRWLHGDFEPGARNRLGPFIVAITVALAALTPAVPSIAESEEDAERIEMKFEVRKLAREIFDRADKRAKEAAKLSESIQKNNDVMTRQLEECMAISKQALDKLDRTTSPRRKDELLGKSKWALSQEPNGCIRMAFDANPNSEIIDELREDFIEEELEALRDTFEEPRRKELESEIQGLSA